LALNFNFYLLLMVLRFKHFTFTHHLPSHTCFSCRPLGRDEFGYLQ